MKITGFWRARFFMRVETRCGHACNRVGRRADFYGTARLPRTQRLVGATQLQPSKPGTASSSIRSPRQRHGGLPRLATAARFYITKCYMQTPISAHARPRQRHARWGRWNREGMRNAAQPNSRAGQEAAHPAERQTERRTDRKGRRRAPPHTSPPMTTRAARGSGPLRHRPARAGESRAGAGGAVRAAFGCVQLRRVASSAP